MEVLILEDEVHRELMGANGNKAPGSNEFPFKFGQTY